MTCTVGVNCFGIDSANNANGIVIVAKSIAVLLVVCVGYAILTNIIIIVIVTAMVANWSSSTCIGCNT